MKDALFQHLSKDYLRITIFGQKIDDGYRNLFTYVRNQLSERGEFAWRALPDSKAGLIQLDGCFSMEEGLEFLRQMTDDECSLECSVDDQLFPITFGTLQRRAPVFIPYANRNSVANDWWPGSLDNGFWLEQWFCVDASVQLSNRTQKKIRNSLGIDIDKLSDLSGTITCAEIWNEYTPTISYNPDFQLLSFSLLGEVKPVEHRLSLHAWETEEAVHREIVDMCAGNDFANIALQFEPMRVGFDLYRKIEQGWMLIASKRVSLMMSIHVDVGIVDGKLLVNKGDETEERDIVTYSSRPSFPPTRTPWKMAERTRNRVNRAVELQQNGSIFVRPDTHTKKQLLEMIDSEIFEPAKRSIYIWDAYLDASVLPELLVKALSIRSMNIRLMLSEPGSNAKRSSNLELAEQVTSYTRCKEIRDYLDQQRDHALGNLEIRNWYNKKGRKVFHDRFILTDHSVWHLGSSLKDLGEYHTTIYRLPDEMADKVRDEFEEAWEYGKFGPLHAVGFSVAPEIAWLPK